MDRRSYHCGDRASGVGRVLDVRPRQGLLDVTPLPLTQRASDSPSISPPPEVSLSFAMREGKRDINAFLSAGFHRRGKDAT